jgi:protein SMG7
MMVSFALFIDGAWAHRKGSAFNQLAVISTYAYDDLATTYYYFRALAVRQAFKNVDSIIDKFLKKVMEKQAAQSRLQDLDEEEGNSVASFTKGFMLAIATLYRCSGSSRLLATKEHTLSVLSDLLKQRQLSSENIIRLTTIIIGAHWRARSQASIHSTNGGSRDNQSKAQTFQNYESLALEYLLSFFSTILFVAADEVNIILKSDLYKPAEAVADNDEDDSREFYPYLTAPLRRLLPSMRLLSKWIKLNLDYLSRYVASSRHVEENVSAFWQAYKDCIGLFTALFPIDRLPSLTDSLEEDDDMRKFIPLDRGIAQLPAGYPDASDDGERVPPHPNEEQLMRISALQSDARLLMQTEVS